MDASTRLYTRLGEIPEDPNNPESLDDLLVCAFGAFERYYVCWKTKGGMYRQDGYDLPPALKDWLYPIDGTTRDFATLQVVFGRGQEYFASDKYGKLEYKETETKKPPDDEGKFEKTALRRSRTVSFLRPLSETSTKSEGLSMEPIPSRRSSSISSQRASRPPSLSYSRQSTDVSTTSQLPSRTNSQSSFTSQWVAESWNEEMEDSGTLTSLAKPKSSHTRKTSRARFHDDMSLEKVPPKVSNRSLDLVTIQTRPTELSIKHTPTTNRPRSPSIVSEIVESHKPSHEPVPCGACGCHMSSRQRVLKASYADASVQTDLLQASVSRSNLRIDTDAAHWPRSHDYSATWQETEARATDDYQQATNPVFIGRMMDYFSKPGYQLGDSLTSGYQSYEQPLVFQYQDEFGDEALR
ncbi:hypothetical protein IQ07DRAFT_584574 [Pyrenochaeta sp. DS3sAY3a]|nr:hypothetical protein IQ07DRAFT_584574 [Pyrenochaeta sp. DS3sAY3a]